MHVSSSTSSATAIAAAHTPRNVDGAGHRHAQGGDPGSAADGAGRGVSARATQSLGRVVDVRA